MSAEIDRERVVTKQFPARIAKEDMLRLAQVQLRWQLERHADSQIPMTAIFRSVIAATLPLLEQMDAPLDELDLTARLEELVRTLTLESRGSGQ